MQANTRGVETLKLGLGAEAHYYAAATDSELGHVDTVLRVHVVDSLNITLAPPACHRTESR